MNVVFLPGRRCITDCMENECKDLDTGLGLHEEEEEKERKMISEKREDLDACFSSFHSVSTLNADLLGPLSFLG